MEQEDLEEKKPETEEQKTEETEKETEATEEEGKKKQSRDENSYYAKKRREREALEAENARLKGENEKLRESKRNAVSDEALSDLGMSKEDLKDDENLRLAELYAQGAMKGEENPASYAYKALREEARNAKAKAEEEARKKTEAEEAGKKAVDDAFADFTKTYGKEAFGDLTNQESLFMRKYGKVVTAGNLVELYGIFKKDVEERTEKAKDNGVLPNPNGSADDVNGTAKKVKYAEDYADFN